MSALTRPNSSHGFLDELLLDIAIRIQLSPTMHALAVERYHQIAGWIEREGSPLLGRVRFIYPQGSMAIGATIRTKDADNLFDIDLIAEIDGPPGTTPFEMLAMLFAVIRGEKGSLYYDKTTLQTRCVTIQYADMHLDITPMVRNPQWPERGGWIPHAKATEPATKHLFVPANPYGFAQDFDAKTSVDDWFARTVLQKSYGRLIRSDAEPIPDHERLYAKPMAVVALQLLKRHVYIIHEPRPDAMRRPPSVYLAESAARNAGRTRSLSEEVIYQADCLRQALELATTRGEKIEVRNPKLWDDLLTDRWPEDAAAQRRFTTDLQTLAHALGRLRAATEPEAVRDQLAWMFGEKATLGALTEFYDRARQQAAAGASRFRPTTATILTGLSAAPSARADTVAVPKHRFFGD